MSTRLLHILLVILLSLSCTHVVWSQGFDWQYSARFPVDVPTRFYGIELGGSYGMFQGSLDYVELATGFPCCTYDAGRGTHIRGAVTVDSWLTPVVSLQLGIGLDVRSTALTSNLQTVPRRNGNDITVVTTQYELDGTVTYGQLSGALRYRLFDSHLNVGLGTRILLRLAAPTVEQRERILGPDDQFFTGNPPSKVANLPSAVITDASDFVLEPFALLAYDISLHRGTYLSPTFTVGMSVNSLSSTQSWRTLDLGLGIRLVRAF
ncbi:MAG TPA: hypothetical protein PLW14_00980 [Chlorobiota bacterium]|nr:hypothetical protein [Chlorobiota bacterium]